MHWSSRQNRRVPGRRQRGPDESCGCAQALELLGEFPIAGVVLNRRSIPPGYDYGYDTSEAKGGR